MSGMLCADNTYYVSPVFTAHLCKVCAYPIKEVSMHIYIYGILVVEFQDSFWKHRIRSFFIRSLLVIFNHEFRSSGEPPPDKMGLRIWCRCELLGHRRSTPRAWPPPSVPPSVPPPMPTLPLVNPVFLATPRFIHVEPGPPICLNIGWIESNIGMHITKK